MRDVLGWLSASTWVTVFVFIGVRPQGPERPRKSFDSATNGCARELPFMVHTPRGLRG